MKSVGLVLVAALLIGGGTVAAQDKVEATGITSVVRLEEVIYGHLLPLNGKFALRATEVTIAPAGALGAHHHVGPGIRYVLSGELTFTEGGQQTIFRAGDYFFETGNIAHIAQNNTHTPVHIIFFEVIPANWGGPTVILPKSQ
jgi:quercetin dioxygenase-like cupin family protein